MIRRMEMFYLTYHSKHFLNGYMASDIQLRVIQIARKEIFLITDTRFFYKHHASG